MKNDIQEAKDEIKAIREEESWFKDILHDYKLANKRMYIIILVLIFTLVPALVGSVVYTIYLLNDLSTVETVDVQQENESGDNNYIGNDGDINGKTESKNR